jgi:hypothetical protein
MMRRIVRVHFPGLDKDLLENSIGAFYRMRQIDGIEKRPATRELINWIRALKADPDCKPAQIGRGEPPYLGILFKKSQDYQRAREAAARRRL